MKKRTVFLAAIAFCSAASSAVIYSDLNLQRDGTYIYSDVWGGYVHPMPQWNFGLRDSVSGDYTYIQDKASSAWVFDNECLVLTKGGEFVDQALFLPPGKYNDLRDYGFNDSASAGSVYDLKLGCGEKFVARLYEHPNAGGRRMIGVPGARGFSQPMDNKISYMVIPWGLCVKVYADPLDNPKNGSFSQVPQVFTPGVWDLKADRRTFVNSNNKTINVDENISWVETYACPL